MKNDKKQFEAPILNVIKFTGGDIIVTSTQQENDIQMTTARMSVD